MLFAVSAIPQALTAIKLVTGFYSHVVEARNHKYLTLCFIFNITRALLSWKFIILLMLLWSTFRTLWKEQMLWILWGFFYIYCLNHVYDASYGILWWYVFKFKRVRFHQSYSTYCIQHTYHDMFIVYSCDTSIYKTHP